jgi:hypothetical protein
MDGVRMASPLCQGRPADVLLEGLGELLTIERRSMPVAARLTLSPLGEHTLYLDPDASEADRETALAETLAVLLFGPDAAPTARRARHLYSI